jgi:polyisoprenoid-binding protein YceI
MKLAALLLSAASLFSVSKDGALLRYTIKHKLHEVSAESHEVEGKAKLLPDGTVQLMVRAPVASFRSGDGNRDEHMLETTGGQSYPFVTFKGLAHLPAPASYPATVTLSVAGELEFHGQKNPETIPVTVELASAQQWHVTAAFDISLDRYKIERPSLLLIPIDDACHMDLDLRLTPSP